MKRGFLRTLLVCVLVLCMLGNTALTAFAAPAGGTKKGDANGDGMVLANDAMLVLQYSVKAIPADRVNLSVCDMDGNGKLNIKDATYLQKGLAGIVEMPKITMDFQDFRGFAVTDFNNDGKLNIRDATAIQKHIAKIELT